MVKYMEKLICHACDGRTNGGGGGKWKIGQCSVGPETAINMRTPESPSKRLVGCCRINDEPSPPSADSLLFMSLCRAGHR